MANDSDFDFVMVAEPLQPNYPFHHCAPRVAEVNQMFEIMRNRIDKLEKELKELRTSFILHVIPEPEDRERTKTRRLELDD